MSAEERAVEVLVSSKRFKEMEDDATKFALGVAIPTESMMQKAHNVIVNFLRSKHDRGHRIVYGGTALDMLVCKRTGGKRRVYEKGSIHDIDFYSPNPYRDIVEICNRLYQAGVAHVEGHTAESEGTFKIRAEYGREELADVGYLPRAVFTYLHNRASSPCPATCGAALRTVHADFEIINMLNVLTTPAIGWNKIGAMLKRTTLLTDLFLLPKQEPAPAKRCVNEVFLRSGDSLSKIRELALNWLLKNGGIFTGREAYEHYIRHVRGWKRHLIPNMPTEAFIEGAKEKAALLAEFLSASGKIKGGAAAQGSKDAEKKATKRDGSSVKVVSYHPFLKIWKRRYAIQVDDTDVAVLYDYHEECYTTTDYGKGGRCLSILGTLRHCYAAYHRASFEKRKGLADAYRHMAQQLQWAHRSWATGKSWEQRLGKNAAFRLLQSHCLPTKSLTTPLRASKMRRLKQRPRNPGRAYSFTYRPKDKYIDASNIDFDKEKNGWIVAGQVWPPFKNVSGNES